MSYAPIQSDTTLNDRNPVRNNHSTFLSTPVRKASATSRKRTSRRPPDSNSSQLNAPLLVHSHLCWDWVWQRPQQFISRLSRRHKVLFVETVAPDPELAAP